jgi:glycerophosphoryl diester phosphodiesterase
MKKSYFALGILLAVILFSCKTNKPQGKPRINPLDYAYEILTMQYKLDKQGHRGARGLMPENTWPAMKLALDLGVTTLEMDVVITKDKKVILSHEPFFNHEITTVMAGTYIMSYIDEKDERNYNIYKMNFEETQKFDVGLKPHPRFPKQQKINAVKPLLSDLFDSVRQYMMTRRRPFPYYNIETKCMPATDDIYHPRPEEFTELLMAVIKEKQMEELVIIQSFDFRSLQYLHQKYPVIKTAMLIEDFDKRTLEDQLKALGFIPSIYSPHYSLVNDELIKKCHLQNIKIIPWTVNDKAIIDKLTAMGVDGIITDYPDLFNNKP